MSAAPVQAPHWPVRDPFTPSWGRTYIQLGTGCWLAASTARDAAQAFTWW